MLNVFTGTGIIIMGWFGFNGGSAMGSAAGAVMAAYVTIISASSGALAWVMIDYIRTKRFSGLSYCSGAIAGLVGITPSAGYVDPWAALIIGVVTALFCNESIVIKDFLDIDDALDVFAIHGVGGKMKFHARICRLHHGWYFC